MRDRHRLAASTLIAIALVVSGGQAFAQEHIVLRSDVLLYGDNTEFRNPFREGETMGAPLRK